MLLLFQEPGDSFNYSFSFLLSFLGTWRIISAYSRSCPLFFYSPYSQFVISLIFIFLFCMHIHRLPQILFGVKWHINQFIYQSLKIGLWVHLWTRKLQGHFKIMIGLNLFCWTYHLRRPKRTSLVAQMVKNPPVMWHSTPQVRSLSWENPLKKGMATPSSILA